MSNRYPIVFIHGLYGWGDSDRLYSHLPYWGAHQKYELVHHFREMGYEAFNPSVGPLNSAWDRCCEIWAYLMGGTVDYGKVHSEKYGHARYGRTYEHGALEDWGAKGDHEKIHIIGHSFGGPTVKMFADLIAFGSQEEIDGTPAEELSGLFKANKPQKVQSCTTLSGVNNGTTFASMLRIGGMVYVSFSLLTLVAAIGETNAAKWYDFHMQQFGFGKEPKDIQKGKLHFPWTPSYLKKIAHFASLREDSIAHELGVIVQTEINQKQRTAPNTYYFARRASCYDHDENGNITGLNSKYKWAKAMADLCKKSATMKYVKPYGCDKTWEDNDGIVNVIGQSAPLNAPHKDYEEGEQVKPGLWYNFPVVMSDHLGWAGILEDMTEYTQYYDDMIQFLQDLPDAD